jgi:hypothetical protein
MAQHQVMEFYRAKEKGWGWDNSCPIGSTDLAPGMLQKLRKHNIDEYRLYAIQVRVRKTGDVTETIPACTGAYGECCPYCCEHKPRHKEHSALA